MKITDLFRLGIWVLSGVLAAVFAVTGFRMVEEGALLLGLLQIAGAIFVLSVPASRIARRTHAST